MLAVWLLGVDGVDTVSLTRVNSVGVCTALPELHDVSTYTGSKRGCSLPCVL